jgi:hypothetical protein
MAHKKKNGGPVPRGNKSTMGPAWGANPKEEPVDQSPPEVGSAQEHDPKRRLGDFSGTAEHPRQQPTDLNDGNQHSK